MSFFVIVERAFAVVWRVAVAMIDVVVVAVAAARAAPIRVKSCLFL